MTILDFSSVAEKTWPLLRGYFGSLGHVTVVERFKKDSIYGLSPPGPRGGTAIYGLYRYLPP